MEQIHQNPLTSYLSHVNQATWRRSFERSTTDLTAWLAVFPGLISGDAVIASAELGTGSPEWAMLSKTTNVESAGLWALASQDELRTALARAGIAECHRVLDAGCGPGVISRIILQAGAREVVGVDNNPRMLATARNGPGYVGQRKALRFINHDLAQPLPFEDASFDAVFMGDCWSPMIIPELKRILRPAGRLIVKWASPSLQTTYAWDSYFEARVQMAYMKGVARYRDRIYSPGEYAPASFYGQMRLHGFSQLWTEYAERFAPAPEAFVLSQCHSFGMWFGPFIYENADAEDWRTLKRIYDPKSSGYLFKRHDSHFIRGFTMAVASVESLVCDCESRR